MRFSIALLLAVITLGCVERKLFIRTEPEGAVVSVNGSEIGTSPVVWKFHHYGTVRVTFRKKGYETDQRIVKLKMPWYEYPVLDLFSDVIVPTTINDDHHLEITLQERESTPKEVDKANAAALGVRATALRESLRAEVEREQADAEEEQNAGQQSGTGGR